jgi:hypothetical protein
MLDKSVIYQSRPVFNEKELKQELKNILLDEKLIDLIDQEDKYSIEYMQHQQIINLPVFKYNSHAFVVIKKK